MLRKSIKTALFLSIMIVFVYYQRVSYYRYNTKQDYLYEHKDAFKLPLTLKNQTLQLTTNNNLKNSSRYLKTKITSTLIGNFLTPYITITSHKKSINTYFEIGAKGTRYINLSSFDTTELRNLHFYPHYLKLDNKTTLIAYQNPSIKDKKFLIISPHPDDAEIASFGLYTKHNKNTFVLTITAGDAGVNNYDELYKKDLLNSYKQKAKLRVINSITVPYIGGVDFNNSLNLGYFDSTLKKLYEDKDKNIKSAFTNLNSTKFYRSFNKNPLAKKLKTTKNNWNSLVSDLKTIIKLFNPDIILTPHPKLDAHPDHRYTTLALLDALKQLKTNKQLFLYTNHHYKCELYPFGESYSTTNLPPLFEKIRYNYILSYPLSRQKQKEKLLALESMNDLRQDTEWTSIYGSFKWFMKNLIKIHLLNHDENYLRRAVRSEELFFVINSSELISF